MSDSVVRSFRPQSSEPSYFNNITAAAEQRIRNEINQQVRQEANNAIHQIVTSKDAEIQKLNQQISLLNEQLNERDSVIKELKNNKQVKIKEVIVKEVIDDELRVEVERLKREKRQANHIESGNEFEKFDTVNKMLVNDSTVIGKMLHIIRYGENDKIGFDNEEQEKLRCIILGWKNFLEEYKWKSNYISVKIRRLLKHTETLLNNKI